MIKKTGQVWSIDFIIGMMLFLFVLLLSVRIILTMNTTEPYDLTYREAVYLSDNVLSEGYPKTWTTSDVIIPGIALDNKINAEKLFNYSLLEYNKTKIAYQITGEYLFYFSNGTSILNVTQCIYGFNVPVTSDCEPIISNLTYSNLAKIDRIVFYDNQILRMTFYVWS
jgi:hypothetical protein